MRIKRLGIGVAAAMVAGALPVFSQPIFENWNTATCALTDAATLSIDQPTLGEWIDVRYDFQVFVSYTASLNGQVAFSGALMRAECDPYQSAWCNARDEPRSELGAVRLHNSHATCRHLPERREQRCAELDR